VGGRRIDRWCEAREPDAAAIVRLALQVCDAVAFAHRKLVVHRDLKPSNVLVDAGGHVHLLDFGIGQFTDATGERTQTMWRALTPGYAAPEQLAGAEPSTAVDIYGLGALLHRLLTGRTPPAATEGSETTRPSLLVRNAGDAYHRHYVPLKNDLDRVLLKALAEDPEQRYATAEALGDDPRRWLAGAPVLAQIPNRGARLHGATVRGQRPRRRDRRPAYRTRPARPGRAPDTRRVRRCPCVARGDAGAAGRPVPQDRRTGRGRAAARRGPAPGSQCRGSPGGPRSKAREGPAGSTRERAGGGAGGVRGERTAARGGRPRARGAAGSTRHASRAGPVAPWQDGGSDRACRSGAG